MRKRTPLLLALLVATGVGGCDPCFGTDVCIPSHVMVDGVLYTHTDTPAPAGTIVEFRVIGSDVVSDTSVMRETDSEGRFRLEFPVAASGVLQATLVVHLPDGSPPVEIGKYALSTSRVRGDSRPLEIRLRRGVQHVGNVFWRYSELPARDVDVVFHPVDATLLEGDSLTGRTDGDGLFILRGEVASGTELEGHLVLRPPAPFKARTVPLRMRVLQREADFVWFGIWGVGLHLTYVGEITHADGTPAGGVTVEYARTGGLLSVPETDSTVSRVDGFFGFRLRPHDDEAGEVIARLTFRSAAGDSLVVTDVRLQTQDQDGVIGYLDRWAFPERDAQ